MILSDLLFYSLLMIIMKEVIYIYILFIKTKLVYYVIFSIKLFITSREPNTSLKYKFYNSTFSTGPFGFKLSKFYINLNRDIRKPLSPLLCSTLGDLHLSASVCWWQICQFTRCGLKRHMLGGCEACWRFSVVIEDVQFKFIDI